MNKKLIGILLLIIVASGSWFGYTRWQETQQRAAREAAAARAAAEQAAYEEELARKAAEEQPEGEESQNAEEGAPAVNIAPEPQPVQQASQQPKEQQPSLPAPINEPGANVQFSTVSETLPGPEDEPEAKPQDADGDEVVKVKDLLSNKIKISFSVPFNEDPTISEDDRFVVEQNRLAKLRMEEAARKAKEEAERLARLKLLQAQKDAADAKKYPTRSYERKITLQGIINNEAFVNGKTVTVGSVIEGAKITAINDYEVVFQIPSGHKFVKKMKIN